MKIKDNSKYTSLTAGMMTSVKQEINKENIGFITSLLRDKIYSDPRKAAITETISNAVDEHRKYGITRPVDVVLTSTDIFIRDYACGLCEEDVYNVFFTYLNSTKTDSDEQIGGFGIGAKSPSAYTKNWFVYSYYNGKATTYMSNISGNDGVTHKVVETVCDKDNTGICVQIPLTEDDKRDCARLKDLLKDIYFFHNVYGDNTLLNIYFLSGNLLLSYDKFSLMDDTSKRTYLVSDKWVALRQILNAKKDYITKGNFIYTDAPYFINLSNNDCYKHGFSFLELVEKLYKFSGAVATAPLYNASAGKFDGAVLLTTSYNSCLRYCSYREKSLLVTDGDNYYPVVLKQYPFLSKILHREGIVSHYRDSKKSISYDRFNITFVLFFEKGQLPILPSREGLSIKSESDPFVVLLKNKLKTIKDNIINGLAGETKSLTESNDKVTTAQQLVNKSTFIPAFCFCDLDTKLKDIDVFKNWFDIRISYDRHEFGVWINDPFIFIKNNYLVKNKDNNIILYCKQPEDSNDLDSFYLLVPDDADFNTRVLYYYAAFSNSKKYENLICDDDKIKLTIKRLSSEDYPDSGDCIFILFDNYDHMPELNTNSIRLLLLAISSLESSITFQEAKKLVLIPKHKIDEFKQVNEQYKLIVRKNEGYFLVSELEAEINKSFGVPADKKFSIEKGFTKPNVVTVKDSPKHKFIIRQLNRTEVSDNITIDNIKRCENGEYTVCYNSDLDYSINCKSLIVVPCRNSRSPQYKKIKDIYTKLCYYDTVLGTSYIQASDKSNEIYAGFNDYKGFIEAPVSSFNRLKQFGMKPLDEINIFDKFIEESKNYFFYFNDWYKVMYARGVNVNADDNIMAMMRVFFQLFKRCITPCIENKHCNKTNKIFKPVNIALAYSGTSIKDLGLLDLIFNDSYTKVLDILLANTNSLFKRFIQSVSYDTIVSVLFNEAVAKYHVSYSDDFLSKTYAKSCTIVNSYFGRGESDNVNTLNDFLNKIATSHEKKLQTQINKIIKLYTKD